MVHRRLPAFHVRFTNTAGTAAGFAVQNLGNTAASYSGMLFYDQNNATALFQGFNNVTHEYRINNVASGASINFLIGSSSKFTIASNGNVTGVLGRVVPTSPGGYSAGVRGVNSGTGGNGIGVVGYQGGSGWAVYGETPSGLGVYGLTTNSTAASTGVRGETFSANGTGVVARFSGAGVGHALEVGNGAIEVSDSNRAAFQHVANAGRYHEQFHDDRQSDDQRRSECDPPRHAGSPAAGRRVHQFPDRRVVQLRWVEMDDLQSEQQRRISSERRGQSL